jgi:hypothetical protein
MHVTVLQPLLILAALALVSAVPMLGASYPVATLGASSAVPRANDATADGRESGRGMFRVRSGQLRATTCATHRAWPVASVTHALGVWSVRRGTSVLPPPAA